MLEDGVRRNWWDVSDGACSVYVGLAAALASSDGPCCDCDSRTCQPVMFKHIAKSGKLTTTLLPDYSSVQGND